ERAFAHHLGGLRELLKPAVEKRGIQIVVGVDAYPRAGGLAVGKEELVERLHVGGSAGRGIGAKSDTRRRGVGWPAKTGDGGVFEERAAIEAAKEAGPANEVGVGSGIDRGHSGRRYRPT